MDSNNLKKILHINTIKQGALDNDINNSKSSLDLLNSKINNNISINYQLVKYLGNGVNNSKIYLAKDKSKNINIICQISNVNKKDEKRLLMELSVLDILSKNKNTSPYINPFIDFNIERSKTNSNELDIYTLFPVNLGYKLSNLKTQLKQLDNISFRFIVKRIIKSILHALTAIHKRNIAHQNLDDTSIIISHSPSITVKKNKNPIIKVKLLDFAMGCGNYQVSENILNKFKSSSNSKDIYFQNCLDLPDYFINEKNHNHNNHNNHNNHIEWKNELQNKVQESLKTFKNSDYLKLAQMFDIWCCGRVFYDLLHCKTSNNNNCSMDDGFTNDISWLNKTPSTRNSPKSLKFYGDLINNMMLIPLKNRQSARTLLDKIIIHEKYGN